MNNLTTITALIASSSMLHAATIASSNLDANTLGTTVTWTTDASSSMVTDDLTAIGSAFAVRGGASTVNNISNNGNLSDGVARGFSFEFTTTVAYDLSNFTIDAGHISSGGVDQAYLSDLDLAIEGISGTSYSYSDSIDQIDYDSGSILLPASFDLSGETIAAGTYRLSITMQEGAVAIPGAFTVMDNPSLTGVVAVPEPSSTALLGLGGLALIFRRRK